MGELQKLKTSEPGECCREQEPMPQTGWKVRTSSQDYLPYVCHGMYTSSFTYINIHTAYTHEEEREGEGERDGEMCSSSSVLPGWMGGDRLKQLCPQRATGF